MEVKIKYCVIMGGFSASPWMPWSISLNDEETVIYKDAVKNKLPLNEVKDLYDALDRAYKEVSRYEKECASDYGDEFDPDEVEIRVEFDEEE